MLVGLTTMVLALNAALGDVVASPAGLLALASMLAVGLVLAVAVQPVHRELPASPVRIRAIALRERSRRTAFLRLRDPNAPGRRRPRAPGN